MAHSTVNAKGEFVVFDDDGKKMTKKALAQQSRVETRHPLGLYVTSDEDGTRHFWRGDDEIAEDVWIQQHPHLRRGKDSGGISATPADGGNVGAAQPSAEGDPESQVRQGIREQRAKAKGQRAGSPGNGVGQPPQ